MKFIQRIAGVLVLALAAMGPGQADAIVYHVNRVIALAPGQSGPPATVTGFLETDGTLGQLVRANFIDWSLQLSAPNLHAGSPTLLQPSNSFIVSGDWSNPSTSPVSATATALTFDTSVNDPVSGYFQVQGNANGWCLQTLSVNCVVIGAVAESIGNPGPVATEPRSGSFVFAAAAPVPVPATLPLLLTGVCAAFGIAARRRAS